MIPTFRTLPLAAAAVLALAPAAWADPGGASRVTVEQIDSHAEAPTIDAPSPIDPIVFDPGDGLPADFDALLPPGTPGNASRVVQDGNRNTSLLRAIGRENRSAQLQDGNANVSTIRLNGEANDALTDQRGNRNRAELRIDGDGSAIAAFQDGTNKRIRIEHTGAPTGLVTRQTN